MEGRLKTRTYTNNDGEEKMSLELTVQEVRILDKKDSELQEVAQPKKSPPKMKEQPYNKEAFKAKANGFQGEPFSDDDIPF
jgi:single-stranded DNA-binding protein